MKTISEFVEGEDITGFYLLKSLEVKQTNGTPTKEYFDIVLADKTGEIVSKFWEASSVDRETFFAPMIVKVRGIVQTYREKPQFKIVKLRPADATDEVNIIDFVRAAPVEPEALLHQIKVTAISISDSQLRDIVQYCLEKVGEKLVHYPAGKGMHHAFYAGLSYHITRMLELAEFLCQQRPFLQRDLLVAGILLHDIAKTVEMEAELGIVTEYSLQGKLIGHITLAYGWVTEAALHFGYDSERILALKHLILSHHNLGEWGSPVQPQLPEAVALHYIDQLDAKLQAVEDAVKTILPGQEWSAPVRCAENKQIYKLNWDK